MGANLMAPRRQHVLGTDDKDDCHGGKINVRMPHLARCAPSASSSSAPSLAVSLRMVSARSSSVKGAQRLRPWPSASSRRAKRVVLHHSLTHFTCGNLTLGSFRVNFGSSRWSSPQRSQRHLSWCRPRPCRPPQRVTRRRARGLGDLTPSSPL